MDEATEAVNLSFHSNLPDSQALAEMIDRRLNADVAREVRRQESTPIFAQLSRDFHVTSVEKGFWGEPEWMDKIAGKLALVHSEVTEVLEALRKSQGADKVTEEFADIFIRCLDLHGELVDKGEATNDLYQVMMDKAKANKERPPKHGNRWG